MVLDRVTAFGGLLCSDGSCIPHGDHYGRRRRFSRNDWRKWRMTVDLYQDIPNSRSHSVAQRSHPTRLSAAQRIAFSRYFLYDPSLNA